MSDQATGRVRDLDIIVYGATGFVGILVAGHLALHAPAGTRIALAGRSQPRLEAVRDRLGVQWPVLVADAAAEADLEKLAAATHVMLTTVGPYGKYGRVLAHACAEAGTDYVDLTGEVVFARASADENHKLARLTGARIVHSCGFDSIPHDLGVFFTLQHLPTDGPVSVRGVARSNATFSGGTFHSAMTAMSRARQMKAALDERRKKEGRPSGRSSRAVTGKPHRDKLLGYWLLPLPTIDPQVVQHSGAALASYGPKFTYSHFAGTKTLRYAAGGVAGVSALAVGAQIKPVRNLLKKRVPQGEGPDEARRRKSWFTVDFVGEAGGETVHTRVSGGDPGYTETAKMLAESALCLALDTNPETAGQVTTAVAMGQNLLTRLQKAGIKFEVVSS